MMRKSGIRWLCGLTLVATAVGCNDALVGGLPVTSDGANLYGRLGMNHHAVLLSMVAPYNTVQLSTIPRDLDDNEWMPDHLTAAERDSVLAANPPRYLSQDETRVRVSADGLVRAVGTTTITGTVRVIATRQLGNVTRADTTLVRVLNEPSPHRIRTFRLRPADSLKVAAGSTLPVVLTALDSANTPISGVVTYARSSDADVISIVGSTNGGASGWNVTNVAGASNKLGSARIVSQAYVYGVAVTDTITVMNGYYITGSNTIYTATDNNGTVSLYLAGPDISIGPGGIIQWINDTRHEALSIEFDEPATALPALLPEQNTGGGNIILIPFDSTLSSIERSRFRRFLAPGVYTYRTNPYGVTGRVVVKHR